MTTGSGAELLQAAREHLNPAEQRAADILIDAEPDFLGLPVARIAEAAGTSQATLIRLAQRLGYRGFRELRLDLVRGTVTGADRTVFEAISAADSPRRVAEKVAGLSMGAIEESCRLLDEDVMSRVVAAISGAPRIEVYGTGASGLAALDTAAKLRRVGLPAWSYPDAHQQAQSASLLNRRCVVLAVSHSGATRDVLRAASLARDVHALVVALTSFPLSPLAKMADECLITGAAAEPTERSGSTLARIAQLYVADVLTVSYSLAHPSQSRNALRRTSSAVEDRRVPPQPAGGRSTR